MHSRTKWLALIPVLAVLMAVTLLVGAALAEDGPNKMAGQALQPAEIALADENPAINSDTAQVQAAAQTKDGIALGMPLAVAGTENVRMSAEDAELLELINGERREAGLEPLVADNMLMVMARLKAQDMAEKGYLSHRSPVYGTMEDMLREAGYSYREMEESLARAYDASSAHRLFMRYSSLKARVLSPDFDRIGVSVVPADGYSYVVEVFVDLEDGEQPQEPPADAGRDNDGDSNSGQNNSGGSGGTERPALEPRSNPQPAPGANDDEREMLNLVNRERVQRGLEPLQFDSRLTQLARLKAQDMVENNYFSHTSPTYGSPFEMMREAGIRYVYAGENLAMAPSVQRAHDGLMNSSGHRANILSDNFDRVGIGVVSRGYYKYFVQMFTGGQRDASPAPAPRPQPEPSPQPEPQPQPGSGVDYLTQDERQMFQLVNQERARYGVPALRPNYELVKLARLKAGDMIEKNYFSHTSPTYGSPFDMMRQFGISYSYAGENLAGAPSVSMAHENLMNSSGHRRNILNSNFTEVGIGIVNGGPYGKMFVQMFIQP
ncbi:CAP domain-containing protein [Desulfoscipio geothermicus]|uniref:Uncharacterized protein, YkwD family n=1 Tax=Desulfoscipio geothermicus DSM 3669 TaxID=1121426 RepID=A0A1I6DFX4_9FIRM|nr:CAP domain-containing protein [Desulfoscipio geothermicus]SFR04329.1 uncharacterized protein, YkwD family [Desulfoscipio geothermicus DSM 3669]